VDSIDASALYEMAIDGMLEELDDPYTSYLGPEAFSNLSLNTTGNYGGVGIRIEARDSWINVVAVLPDTPGERAGLQAGDQVIGVDGKSTEDWSVEQASSTMRGEVGTYVTLTVRRPGVDETIDFEIERARVHVNAIEGVMKLTPAIGYLRVTSVTSQSARELVQAIAALRRDGASSLVLDLRGNPGGVLEQGVAISDFFLEKNDVAVETRGRARGESRIFRAQHEELWPDMPVVILVNGFTASAAEIISGALQDHDRALVLGTKTFGKGVAYRVFPLSDSQAVSVTSSRWYTPSGRSINRPLTRHGRPDDAGAGVDDEESDSAEVFRSVGGRPMRGGGGIHPDITIESDTLTTAEQAFSDELGASVPVYFDAMTRYALGLKAEGTIDSPDFQVTPSMLRSLRTELVGRGVTIDDGIWEGASSLVADQLGYWITRYVFGRPDEIRRRTLDDNQVEQAVELLSNASTTAELIGLAQR
jgi:carboxyl-terminal processing protease